MESAVGHVSRQILARIDHLPFSSVHEINEAIAPLLDRLNDASFQKRPGSRSTQFQDYDFPALSPLNPDRFVLREWKIARVNLDYHVEVNKAFYSVPYEYAHQEIEVIVSEFTVELSSDINFILGGHLNNSALKVWPVHCVHSQTSRTSIN